MKNILTAAFVAFAIVLNSFSFVSAQSGRTSASVSFKDLLTQSKSVSVKVEEGFSSEVLMKRVTAQFLRKESGNKFNVVAEGDDEDFIVAVSREVTKDNKRNQKDREQTQLNRAAKKSIRETERGANEAKSNVKRNIPRKFRGLAGVFTDALIDRQKDKRVSQTEDLIQSDRYVQERMNVIVTISFVRPSDNKVAYEFVGNVVLQVVTRDTDGATQMKVADTSLEGKGLPQGTVLTDKNFQTINELAFMDAFEKTDGSYMNQTIGR